MVLVVVLFVVSVVMVVVVVVVVLVVMVVVRVVLFVVLLVVMLVYIYPKLCVLGQYFAVAILFHFSKLKCITIDSKCGAKQNQAFSADLQI